MIIGSLSARAHIMPYRDCAGRLWVTFPPLPSFHLPSHFEYTISRLEADRDADCGKAFPGTRSLISRLPLL